MKKIIFCFIIFFSFISPIYAEEFDLYSDNVLFYNLEEDKIMYEKNADEKVSIASLTKVISAMVMIDLINDYDKKIDFDNVDFNFLRNEDLSISSLDKNKTYTYRDFIYSFIMESSADCGYALVLDICDSTDEFVKLMNNKAKELGMNSSKFSNPIGLDDINNYSTMNDLLILMKASLNNSLLKTIMSTFEYEISDGSVIHHTIYYYMDHFDLNMPYLKGGKTGYNDDPGFTFMGYGNMNNSTYIFVSSNATYDYNNPKHLKDAAKLFNYYFKNYGYQKLLEKDDIVLRLDTLYAKEEFVNIRIDQDVTMFLNSNYDSDKIKTVYNGIEVIKPSYEEGKYLGKLTVYYDNEVVSIIDIYLTNSVSFSLINFISYHKFIVIAIVCYSFIISSTWIIVRKIKKRKFK